MTVQLNKKIKDTFPKHRHLYLEFLYRSNTKSIMNFLIMTEIVSSSQN